MDNTDLVKALRAQMQGADKVRPLHYDSAERRAWEKEAVELLRDNFGADSPQVLEFLDAPLGKLTPDMSEREWQDNYDYLLRNQAMILEKVIRELDASRERGDEERGKRKIGVVGVGTRPPSAEDAGPAPALSDSFLLDAVEKEHRYVPEVSRTAIIGLQNLIKAEAPWPEVRQQIFVVLAAERPIALSVLRALPSGLHLCRRDR